MFKAVKKKNPDLVLYDESMHNYDNSKDWLTAALKKSNNLKENKCGLNVLKSEVGHKQIVPCTRVFQYKHNQLVKASNAKRKSAWEET